MKQDTDTVYQRSNFLYLCSLADFCFIKFHSNQLFKRGIDRDITEIKWSEFLIKLCYQCICICLVWYFYMSDFYPAYIICSIILIHYNNIMKILKSYFKPTIFSWMSKHPILCWSYPCMKLFINFCLINHMGRKAKIQNNNQPLFLKFALPYTFLWWIHCILLHNSTFMSKIP